MHDALGRYPVSVSIPVAWGEMDSRAARPAPVDEPLRSAIAALEAAAPRPSHAARP